MHFVMYNDEALKNNPHFWGNKEKKMKKIISVLVVLALACTMLFAFTSCGGGEAGTDTAV